MFSRYRFAAAAAHRSKVRWNPIVIMIQARAHMKRDGARAGMADRAEDLGATQTFTNLKAQID